MVQRYVQFQTVLTGGLRITLQKYVWQHVLTTIVSREMLHLVTP